jgi:DNA-binding IclR family transcriptional regulator
MAMDGWWEEIESAVLEALRETPELAATEIARRLGIPEAGAASLLGVLAANGTVRIVRVAAA